MENTTYTIKPVDKGYTWPLNAYNQKIEVINNKLNETHPEKIIHLDWIAQDGPYLLTDFPDIGSLNVITEAVFGESKEAILEKSKDSWEPYIVEKCLPAGRQGKDEARRIIISGTTNNINARDGVDIDYLKKTGNVIGANCLKETRELALANPGDIAFGNSVAWKEVAKVRTDVETNELGEGFLNYNSHRWLYKLLRSIDNSSGKLPDIDTLDPQLQMIVNHLAIDPNLVIQVYATDEEHDIFFYYLHKQVNKLREELNLPKVEKLKVDANSLEVSQKLASKGFLYPKPEDVIDIDSSEIGGDTYENWLVVEGKFSGIEKELGRETPRMPGYNIEWEENFENFKTRVAQAVDLMHNRWGSETNFFKNTQGADGSGSFKITAEELNGNQSTEKINQLAEKLHREGHSWVVEPFVNYRKFEVKVNGSTQQRILAPSVHVRGGLSYNNKLIQLLVTKQNEDGTFTETTEWGGHIFAPRSYVDRKFAQGETVFGMSEEEYNTGFGTLKQLADQFAPQGFSRGGIDTAIGTIQTKWGEREVNALQDMNIRTNAGDTTRAFGKMIEREFGEEKPFATLVIKPKMGVNYEQVDGIFDELAEELDINRDYLKLVCTIPPGWGLFGIASESPELAAEQVFAVEKKLRERGVIN